MKEIYIKGGTGKVFQVNNGDCIKVIDLEGKQVVDFIAFCSANTHEFLSTSHSRMISGSLYLHEGQLLYSNFRNALLKLLEDTVGSHDMLYPCCDPPRYKQDFGVENHPNCRENFAKALKPYNVNYWQIPDPINIFQNSPINSDGSYMKGHKEPKSNPGDYVIFEALTDLVVGVSACPNNFTLGNGGKITDILVQIINQD